MILLTIGLDNFIVNSCRQAFLKESRLPYFAIIVLLALVLTVCIMIYLKVDKKPKKKEEKHYTYGTQRGFGILEDKHKKPILARQDNAVYTDNTTGQRYGSIRDGCVVKIDYSNPLNSDEEVREYQKSNEMRMRI